MNRIAETSLHAFLEGHRLSFDGRKTVLVPYMRVASVQDGYLRTDIITDIEVLPEDIERYRLQPGDVLLTEGGDPDKLGRRAVWRGELETCIHQNHVFRVRPEQTLLDPDFLSALIGSGRGKTYFARAAKQTTGIASINMTQLRAFSVLLPPLSLQLEFSQVVSRERKHVEHMQKSVNMIDALFNSTTSFFFQRAC
jgi:type I restriction enzyme S subunit